MLQVAIVYKNSNVKSAFVHKNKWFKVIIPAQIKLSSTLTYVLL